MFTKGQPISPGLGRRWSNWHKLLWSRPLQPNQTDNFVGMWHCLFHRKRQ